MARIKGFTLYELMLTLLLLVLLAGTAIPSFSALIARQRQRVEIDALFHAVHQARLESIMRRQTVALCPSTDGIACADSTDWSGGWLMFENRDRDSPAQIDSDEPILLQHTGDHRVMVHANRKSFTLRATFLRATNGTLIICDPLDRVAARALVISYTGRPRVARHTRQGELYSCAD